MGKKTEVARALFVPKTVWELIVFAVLLLVLWMWIMDRDPVGSREAYVLTPEVAAGQEFRIRYSVIWDSRCRVTSWRFIIDDGGVPYAQSMDARIVSEGEDEFVVTLVVPEDAREGEAEYRATAEFACNALQRIFPVEQKLESQTFIILPGQGPDNVVAREMRGAVIQPLLGMP